LDAATLRKLEAADDSQHCECPPDFDWQKSMERVRFVQPMLEKIAGRPLSLDDQIQDATYFADLCIAEPREVNGFKQMRVTFSVSFSCFGSLVTIYNENVLPEEKVRQMRTTLEEQSFVFVDAVQLREPYTGAHAGFHGSTWMDRFFNYT